MLSQVSKWQKLHTLVIGAELHTEASIVDITELLTGFSKQLKDVTARFRVFNKEMVYVAYSNKNRYVVACHEFKEALSRFDHHHLSFQISSTLPPRKLLWTRELGQRFPALRDQRRLTVTCESSEKLP